MPSRNWSIPKRLSMESGMVVCTQDILVGMSHHMCIPSVSAPSCPAKRERMWELEGTRGTSAERVSLGGNFTLVGEKKAPVV